MVIKDEHGKIVVLMTKKDILDYVFEKCGLAVGFEVESEFKKADGNVQPENCEGCLKLRAAKTEVDGLRDIVTDLADRVNYQKQMYIDHLKEKHLYAAAKALENFEEDMEE